MAFRTEIAAARSEMKSLSLYDKFEHAVVLIVIGLIAVVILFAVWNLVLKIAQSILTSSFDPTDYVVFQAVFGMIFTVIIALEFKRSLLALAERENSVVQVRAVILIALLAVVRKLILLDVKETDAMQLLGLAAAILALGAVYWMVRDQDRRHAEAKRLAAREERAPGFVPGSAR